MLYTSKLVCISNAQNQSISENIQCQVNKFLYEYFTTLANCLLNNTSI